MINLDDRDVVLKIQGGDSVLQSVNALPQQLQQSFSESYSVDFSQEYKNINNIVISGMGGSRFPALIIKELFKKNISVPYVINDDYVLPEFVNNNTLFVLSSYSGTTEEVLETAKLAQKKGAKLIGITAGGEVASLLRSINAPVYVFDPIHNSSGQPRIGFGYAVGGHLGLMMKLGFIKFEKKYVDLAISNLSKLLSSFLLEVSEDKNPAKQLAHKIHEKYPYYVISEFLTGVGNAVQNQTNETAKSISSFRIIPELNHHLMEGLKFPTDHKKMALFIFFYSSLYSSPIQKRFQITKEVVEQNGIKTVWHELQGKTELEQAFELMGLGSYISMYLSALYEQDPTAIPYVDYFKKKLSKF